MTDRSKFEQMLEYLINEDEQKAKEIFHDIVVEKSREIYESLLESDFDPAVAGSEEGEQSAMEAGDDIGGDAGDDMLGDIEDDGDDMGGDDMGDMDGEGDDVNLSGSDVDELQDRVVDLEDALDALRDEFESLMGGEEGPAPEGDDEAAEGMPGMDGVPGEEEEEMSFEARGEEEEEEEEESRADEEFIREYVEKVTAKMGDNGANTKSVVAGKNDMGGTTANIAKGGEAGKGGTQGGLLNPSTKDLNSGNVNVPGGKAGVKHLKTVSAGHGAEKKGSKPDSEKSLLGK